MSRPCEVCDHAEFRRIGTLDGHPLTKCGSCGLERLDPQPTDEDLAKIYGAQYYDAWGLPEHPEAVAALKRRTFLRVIRAAGRLPAGGKILDCGAATGFLMGVAREEGYEPYGVEISDHGVAEIEKAFGKGRVFHGMVEDARFDGVRDGDFCAAFLCDFIEHVRHPERVLRRVAEMLAPGGVIVITTPNVRSLSHLLMGKTWPNYKAEHLYYFNADTLGRLLQRVGFSRVATQGARKSLSFDYVARSMQVYPHPLLTPATTVASRILPAKVRQLPISLVVGDFMACARKA